MRAERQRHRGARPGHPALITYVAVASREGFWWVLEVDGVGVTECRFLRNAEAVVRDMVATALDVSPDSFEVEVQKSLARFRRSV